MILADLLGFYLLTILPHRLPAPNHPRRAFAPLAAIGWGVLGESLPLGVFGSKILESLAAEWVAGC